MLIVPLGGRIAPQPAVTRGEGCKIDCEPLTGKAVVYASGKNVVVRSVDPKSRSLAAIFSGHRCTCTVARYSPCGTLVASGDVQGNLLVWTVAEQRIRLERRLWGGKINDIAWEQDGDKLFIAGEKAAAIALSRESSLGTVSAHTRPANCVAWRGRTGEAVTGADDFTICRFSGAPMQLTESIHGHSSFVQSVSFSPDGTLMASAGSDRRVLLQRFTSGGSERVAAVAAHEGGVFGLCWIDNERFVTASADKTAKLWRVDAGGGVGCLKELGLGNQALGLSYSPTSGLAFAALLDGTVVMLSVSGDSLLVVDELKGHFLPIQQLFCSKELCSLDASGILVRRSLPAGQLRMAQLPDRCEAFLGSTFEATLSYGSLVVKSGGHETKVDDIDSFACNRSSVFHLSATAQRVGVVSCDDPLASIATYPVDGKCDGSRMAAGDRYLFLSNSANELLFYSIQNGPIGKERVSGTVSCISISPDERYVAVGTKKGPIQVFSISCTHLESVVSHEWSVHCGPVYSMCWDGDHLYSASLDGCIIRWSLGDKFKWSVNRGAHSGPVHCLALGEGRLYSGGGDGCINEWTIGSERSKQ